MRVVGIISGTSFDAIETAAADLRLEDGVVVLRPLGSRGVPYDPGLRAAVADALPPAATSAGEVCMLDTHLGHAFAEAAALAAQEFCGGRADLIVSHGQTIFHRVEGEKALGTLQLGQPAWISGLTGSPVVSDLRSRDIAEGGQGAPLTSKFDVLLLGGGEAGRTQPRRHRQPHGRARWRRRGPCVRLARTLPPRAARPGPQGAWSSQDRSRRLPGGLNLASISALQHASRRALVGSSASGTRGRRGAGGLRRPGQSSSHPVTNLSLAWMSTCRSRPAPEFTNCPVVDLGRRDDSARFLRAVQRGFRACELCAVAIEGKGQRSRGGEVELRTIRRVVSGPGLGPSSLRRCETSIRPASIPFSA